MEKNEISMLIDVKLDLKEKNFEMLNLRVSNKLFKSEFSEMCSF